MTNNQFCNCIGIIGCLVMFFSMGLMFFGVSSAIWSMVAGILFSGLALVNYD